MSARQIHEALQRVRWAIEDVRIARDHRIKRIRRGYLRSALNLLGDVELSLVEIERQAWEET